MLDTSYSYKEALKLELKLQIYLRHKVKAIKKIYAPGKKMLAGFIYEFKAVDRDKIKG